jgi:DNA invertase Pin-like site-specific DNA recombinase
VLNLLNGIDFICCDKPYLNQQTLHISLARAEFFAQHVSQTTKEGLVGKVMGYARPGAKRPDTQKRATKKAARNRVAKARKLYQMLPFDSLRAEGFTYEEIAEKLNEAGHRTTIGTPFNGPTVYRIMHRAR